MKKTPNTILIRATADTLRFFGMREFNDTEEPLEGRRERAGRMLALSKKLRMQAQEIMAEIEIEEARSRARKMAPARNGEHSEAAPSRDGKNPDPASD